MADETFYRDQILSNAAVLFPDTFRIVLRAKKNEGRQNYEAVLVDGSSHRILLAGGPGLHSIQEALFNLLIATSNQMTDHLQSLADRESEAHDKHHGSAAHHGITGPTGSSAHHATTGPTGSSAHHATTGPTGSSASQPTR